MPEELNGPSQRVHEEREAFACSVCSMSCDDATSLDAHVKCHMFSGLPLPDTDLEKQQEFLYEEVKKQQDEEESDRQPVCPEQVKSQHHRPRRVYKRPAKQAGLTKIRLEDCLRCDACSCIYLDPQDYYKHMKNFHEKYNTAIPRTRKSQMNYYASPPPPPSPRATEAPSHHYPETPANNDSSSPSPVIPQLLTKRMKQSLPIDTSFIEKNLIRHKIQTRWSKVSERLVIHKKNRMKAIKQEEPEDGVDMSYLLSQVEVRIKTEPPDES